MELAKLSAEEIKGFDIQRLQEVANDARRELAMLRMDPYSDKTKLSGQRRGLKKTLARVLTYRQQLLSQQTK